MSLGDIIGALDGDLGLRISALACLCSRIVNAVRKPHKLTLFEFHTLLAIHARHPSCVSALTDRTAMDRTRASKVLRSLENRGYVRRSRDIVDHRIEHILLTEDGAGLANSLLHEIEAVGKMLFSRMPEKEQTALVQFLESTGEVRTDIFPPSVHPPSTIKERQTHE